MPEFPIVVDHQTYGLRPLNVILSIQFMNGNLKKILKEKIARSGWNTPSDEVVPLLEPEEVEPELTMGSLKIHDRAIWL